MKDRDSCPHVTPVDHPLMQANLNLRLPLSELFRGAPLPGRLLVWVFVMVAILSNAACGDGALPDGIYANIYTTKGQITARLEMDLTPMTVANFVGLAEGTIENDAFDLGRPFYDGTAYHRVVPGHVVQTGRPQSERADGPGYTFPNEIHADLSHDHAGALNMANGGPHSNSSQFCVTLGDRSYLDGDYIVFGEVVEGMEVVDSIVEGDVVDSVRIVRIGEAALAFHPTTESFRALSAAAEQRANEHAELKRLAEAEWIARTWPNATGPGGGILTDLLETGSGSFPEGNPRRVVYSGTRVRYLGHMIGYDGPDLEVTSFGSGEDGVPGFNSPPRPFTFVPGETEINRGLDHAIETMLPGERRVVVVPSDFGYGESGLYPPETPGEPRFVISPNTLLVYEVEVRIAEEAG